MKVFNVIEIFTSLQGESTFAGQRCTFIRLAGCNLRCTYCDTRFAYDETATATPMTLDEILLHIDVKSAPLVELTGGEPLLENQLPILIKELQLRGKTVLVETNGSCDISVLPEGTIRIMDIKTPGSGMESSNLFKNIPLLTHNDEIKFVITSYDDFLYAENVIHEYRLLKYTNKIHYSPCADAITYADLAQWILDAQSPARFQIQLHKIIWPNETRGV